MVMGTMGIQAHVFAQRNMMVPRHRVDLEIFVLRYNQREKLCMGHTFRGKAWSKLQKLGLVSELQGERRMQ